MLLIDHGQVLIAPLSRRKASRVRISESKFDLLSQTLNELRPSIIRREPFFLLGSASARVIKWCAWNRLATESETYLRENASRFRPAEFPVSFAQRSALCGASLAHGAEDSFGRACAIVVTPRLYHPELIARSITIYGK